MTDFDDYYQKDKIDQRFEQIENRLQRIEYLLEEANPLKIAEEVRKMLRIAEQGGRD